MAKKATKKALAKKSSSKKSTAKTATKSSEKKKSVKKSGAKTASKNASRASYPEQLKKKVVSAIKKGMTHLEASKSFEVGIHSIPNWIKKHT